MKELEKIGLNSELNLNLDNNTFHMVFRQTEEYPDGILLGYTTLAAITLVNNEEFKERNRVRNKLNLGC